MYILKMRIWSYHCDDYKDQCYWILHRAKKLLPPSAVLKTEGTNFLKKTFVNYMKLHSFTVLHHGERVTLYYKGDHRFETKKECCYAVWHSPAISSSTHTHTRTRTHTHTHTHTHAHTHTRTRTHTHTRAHARTHTHTHARARVSFLILHDILVFCRAKIGSLNYLSRDLPYFCTIHHNALNYSLINVKFSVFSNIFVPPNGV